MVCHYKKSCIFAFSFRYTKPMLLIHVPRLTNRLGYTLNVLFRYILRKDFEITTDISIFKRHEGAKLCYGPNEIGEGVFLRSCDLLFQTTIEEQNPRPFMHEGTAAIFPVYNRSSALPFDPFAATFYCVSRYEEYLPFVSDMHGRFPAKESLAYKNHFLTVAVVDRWALMVASVIKEAYPNESFPLRNFDYEDTFDIDAAYCYKHKGLIRTFSGLGRDLFARRPDEVRKRFRVLLHKEKDPFDVFDYILDVHKKHHGISLKFFPLMADYNVYDKPISYQNKEFQQLLQHLGDYAKMGLHGSYDSFHDENKMSIELERLESVIHRKTVRNRFHFLRMTLPKAYETLLANGITHDYSMGFADEPGYRAGTGNPYHFFDLESDYETQLTIHPFVIMDSTLYYYKKTSVEVAERIYYQLINEAKSVGGRFCALWHNQSICEDFGWQGWRDLYERVIDYVDESIKIRNQ